MSYEKRVTIGNHTLYLGDADVLAPLLGFYDALVTDPPYAFKASGGGKFRKSRTYMDEIQEDGLDQGFNHSIINPLLYKSALVFCHNDQLHKLLPFMRGSFYRSELLSYHKTNPVPMANKSYLSDTEFYIHAWQEGGYPVGTLEERKTYITTLNGKSKYNHPTVKRLDVMDKIMKNVNGLTILDPFMGSGSTGVSAIHHNKTFTGIENKQKYFDIAVERISEAYASGYNTDKQSEQEITA